MNPSTLTDAAFRERLRRQHDRIERALTVTLQDARRGLASIGTVKCAGGGCHKRILWAADSGSPRLCEGCAETRTPFIAGRRTTPVHAQHRRTLI